MVKYLATACAALGVGLCIYALKDNKVGLVQAPKKEFSNGDRFIEFVRWPNGILAQSGELKILKGGIKDPVLKSYEEERKEIAIIAGYRQFVQDSSVDTSVVFFLEKPERPIEAILNQHNVKLSPRRKIQFKKTKDQKAFVQVGGEVHNFDSLERSSYLWGALETKIFHRQLAVIEEKMVMAALTNKAQSLNLGTQQYINEKILGKKSRGLASIDGQNKINLYAKEHLMSLPIQVNLEVPNFGFETKPDWTPSYGDPEANIQVFLFTDFYNESSRHLLKDWSELARKYKQVYFGFRPLFPKGDRYQRMLAEFGFCAWVSDQGKYWSFLGEAVKAKGQNFEKELYRVAQKNSLDLQSIKKCFFEREYKKIVDYHLNYGEFLGISAGPVVFVGGEVLTGGVTKEMIDRILQRKTWQGKRGSI